MIDTNIKQLVEYGIANELIEEEDRIYTTNTILEMLKKDSYEEPGEVHVTAGLPAVVGNSQC